MASSPLPPAREQKGGGGKKGKIKRNGHKCLKGQH